MRQNLHSGVRVIPLSLSSYSNLLEPTQLGLYYRDLQTLSLLQISALTPLRLLIERRRRRRQGGAPSAPPPVDFCERPLRPITKFERSVIDVIRCARKNGTYGVRYYRDRLKSVHQVW